MKRWYRFHAIAWLALLFIGGYLVYDLIAMMDITLPKGGGQNWDRKRYIMQSVFFSRVYGTISLPFFLISIFMGWKTTNAFSKIRHLHILGGLGFSIFSILLINSSRQMHFRFEEAYLAWIAYGGIVFIMDIYILLNYDKVPNTRLNYADEILDDGMNR